MSPVGTRGTEGCRGAAASGTGGRGNGAGGASVGTRGGALYARGRIVSPRRVGGHGERRPPLQPPHQVRGRLPAASPPGGKRGGGLFVACDWRVRVSGVLAARCGGGLEFLSVAVAEEGLGLLVELFGGEVRVRLVGDFFWRGR